MTGTTTGVSTGTTVGQTGTTTATSTGVETSSSVGTTTGSTSASASSTVPTTCAEADDATGCCVGNTRYYCSGSTIKSDDCTTGGNVCGWSASFSNYGCVAAPSEPDPSGANPIACGAASGSSSTTSTTVTSTSSSASSSSASSSSSAAPTWTDLYTTYLAVGTVGDCDSSSCHHHTECSSATACFSWLHSKKLSGGGGLLSWDNGYMPPSGPSSDPAAEAAFTAWAAAGSLDN